MKSHVSKMGIPVYGSSKGTIVLGDNTLGNEKNQANCCLRETSVFSSSLAMHLHCRISSVNIAAARCRTSPFRANMKQLINGSGG